MSKKKPHILKEYNFPLKSARYQVVTYATSLCQKKFNHFEDEHVLLHDLETLMENSIQIGMLSVKMDLCVACVATPEFQMMLLKYTPI